MKARSKAWLANHPAAAKVLGASGWLLSEKLLTLLGGLFVGAWVARSLRPVDWGRLQGALAYIGIFGGVSVLGIQSAVAREMARRKLHPGKLLGTALGIRTGASFVFALLAALMARLGASLEPGLVALLSCVLIFQASDCLEWWLVAGHQAERLVKFKVPGIALGLVLRAVLALGTAGLMAFARAEIATALALALGLGLALRGRTPKLGFDAALAKKLLREGWPLIFSSLSVAIYMRIDQVMLLSMAGPEQSGYYAAAVRLSEAWLFVPVTISMAAYPALAEALDQGAAQFKRRLARLMHLLTAVAAAAMLPLWLLSPWLVALLFGADYAPAGAVLRIHLLSGLFVAFGVGTNAAMLIKGLAWQNAVMTAAGAAMNIALNLAWLPRFGAMGAAWATLISYAVTVSLMPLCFKKSRTLPLLQLKSLIWSLVVAPLRMVRGESLEEGV